jgi:hypothetical protein
MRIVQFQTNFSSGEIDPLLRARTDLAQYQNGLETAKNVIVQPQGGIRRRDGLKFIHDFTGFTDFKIIPFEFSVNDSYTLVFVNQRIYIFKAGVLQTNINASGNDYLAATAITGAMLDEINYTQAVDTLILCHEDLEPQRLVRNSDTSWTLGALPITNIPAYAWTPVASNPAAILTPSAVAGNITVTADSGVFTLSAASYVGQHIYINPFGTLRIIEKQSTTILKCFTEVGLFNIDAVASGEWELELGWEDSWSVARGWPRSATFHEGRLYFGGSKQRQNTIWGSRVIDYFNFDLGTALDDEAVEATINTDQFNAITHIVSGNIMRVFTTGGEFIVSQAGADPITPATFLVRPQTRLGSKPGVPVEDLNGAALFVQRQGKSLNAFQYTDTTASYGAQALSVLSSHLMKDPVDLAARRATSTDETDTIYLVNGQDGSMTVYSILASQAVVAASEFITSGEFLAVGVELDDVYTIVKRTINAATKYYLEKFDRDTFVDSALTGGAASSVNVAHLPNTEVQIIRDGFFDVSQTVPASSPYTVTFSNPATSSYQVGLNYTVTAVTMPAEPRLAQGSVYGVQKRILQVDAIVYETQSMAVNGQEIPFTAFGGAALDQAIVPFTGTKTAHGLLGFSKTGQITITQNIPLKMTLLGLEYRMSVGD